MKSTKLELAQRIQLVKDMLLSYKSFNEIASYLSEKYSLSERQTCIYIKRASRLLKKAILAFFNGGNQKARFLFPFIFINLGSC